MTGKHWDRKQIQLERVLFSEGGDKVVPKRAFPALKSPSACKGLEGPRELHYATNCCGRHFARGLRGIFIFQAEVGMDPETTQKRFDIFYLELD